MCLVPFSIAVEDMQNEPSLQQAFPDFHLMFLNSHSELFSMHVASRSMDTHVCVCCTCGLLLDVTHSKCINRVV